MVRGTEVHKIYMENKQQNADINPDFSIIILYANRLNTPMKRGRLTE